MVITALASFLITSLHPTHWSAIHLLSVVTLCSLALLMAKRRDDIAGHGRAMIMIYAGLVSAGAVTILPRRLLHSVFFGP